MNGVSPVRQPALFVAHGGGPLPLLGHPGHANLTRWLQKFSSTLHAKPKAILVVSAHWEVIICSPWNLLLTKANVALSSPHQVPEKHSLMCAP